MRWARLQHRWMTFWRGHEAAARARGVTIGADCRILSDVTTSESWLVTIGDRVTVSSGVSLVTHDGSGWLYRDERGRRYRYAAIEIGSDVFVGAGSVIMPGVRIDDRVVIGAGAVVTRSVPSGSVVAGNPARLLGSYDDLMDRIASWASEEDRCGHTYRERVMSILESEPRTYLS